MHDGRFKRLRDVIKHYTQLIDFTDSFRDIPRPLLLNEREQTEILSFLYTLTDKTYIFNPEFSNYQAKK
jgi:cytochrome c peroxidase